MSYQKDPIYEVMEGILYAVVTVAWAIIAAIGSLFFKLLQEPPEKRLKNLNHDSSWGDQGQVKKCPACESINNADMPLCSMCGARL